MQWKMYLFSGAALTEWLDQQKFIGLEFWRLEVQDQGIGRVGSFWGFEGEAVHASRLASDGLLAILGFLDL